MLDKYDILLGLKKYSWIRLPMYPAILKAANALMPDGLMLIYPVLDCHIATEPTLGGGAIPCCL